MNKPLFLAGTARGGTNLIRWILDVHPEINLESEPFMPLYRSLRNAIVSKSNNSSIKSFNPNAPIDEYYYFENKLAVMELIQKSRLDIKFDSETLDPLKQAITNRMNDYVPQLIPYLDEFHGNTYKDLFDSGLEIISMGQNNKDATWLGWLDNWIVEFFTPLAREYLDAHFILIFRDVRSSVASSNKEFVDLYKNPSGAPLTLSFLRCWRKQVAFAEHFQNLNIFKNRLHIIQYENLVNNPEIEVRNLCDSLDIEYFPKMLDSNNFKGLGKNNKINNSAFKDPKNGIYKGSVSRWEKSLSSEMIRFIEYIVGPDLEHLGYELSQPNGLQIQDWDWYKLYEKEYLNCKGWRTDNGSPEVDLGLEMLRHQLLQFKTNDRELIKRCFLFPEIYHSLLRKHR
jgi:hypothetical protein